MFLSLLDTKYSMAGMVLAMILVMLDKIYQMRV
jgi:hypothetical protein